MIIILPGVRLYFCNLTPLKLKKCNLTPLEVSYDKIFVLNAKKLAFLPVNFRYDRTSRKKPQKIELELFIGYWKFKSGQKTTGYRSLLQAWEYRYICVQLFFQIDHIEDYTCALLRMPPS
jgi:hypothetical protein